MVPNAHIHIHTTVSSGHSWLAFENNMGKRENSMSKGLKYSLCSGNVNFIKADVTSYSAHISVFKTVP